MVSQCDDTPQHHTTNTEENLMLCFLNYAPLCSDTKLFVSQHRTVWFQFSLQQKTQTCLDSVMWFSLGYYLLFTMPLDSLLEPSE